MEENKTVGERRKRRRFDRFCFPPSDDEENKIVRKRKRRGFDWYYLPPGDDHKEIAEEDEEEEGKKEKKESCRRRWSELPDGILDQVLARLAWPLDVVCFGGVCRPWRSVREGFTPPLRSSCPWLVYRGDGTIRGRGGMLVDASSEKFVFYSLADRDGCWGVRGGQVVVELPGTRGAYIGGCSHGWLFFAYSEAAAPSFLLASCSRCGPAAAAIVAARPPLPPSSRPRLPTARAAWSRSSPTAFSSSAGSGTATGPPSARARRTGPLYEGDSSSIVAHDGKIYFLTQKEGVLGVFDPNADGPKMPLTWLTDAPPLGGNFWPTNCLVESCGQVLLVLLSGIERMRVLKLDLREIGSGRK